MRIALVLASLALLAFSSVTHAEDGPFDRAVSLVSVVLFEVDHCPGVVVNGPMFKVGLVDSGADLDRDDGAIERVARSDADTLHRKGDDPKACADLWARLGPNGTDVLGLLARKN